MKRLFLGVAILGVFSTQKVAADPTPIEQQMQLPIKFTPAVGAPQTLTLEAFPGQSKKIVEALIAGTDPEQREGAFPLVSLVRSTEVRVILDHLKAALGETQDSAAATTGGATSATTPEVTPAVQALRAAAFTEVVKKIAPGTQPSAVTIEMAKSMLRAAIGLTVKMAQEAEEKLIIENLLQAFYLRYHLKYWSVLYITMAGILQGIVAKRFSDRGMGDIRQWWNDPRTAISVGGESRETKVTFALRQICTDLDTTADFVDKKTSVQGAAKQYATLATEQQGKIQAMLEGGHPDDVLPRFSAFNEYWSTLVGLNLSNLRDGLNKIPDSLARGQREMIERVSRDNVKDDKLETWLNKFIGGGSSEEQQAICRELFLRVLNRREAFYAALTWLLYDQHGYFNKFFVLIGKDAGVALELSNKIQGSIVLPAVSTGSAAASPVPAASGAASNTIQLSKTQVENILLDTYSRTIKASGFALKDTEPADQGQATQAAFIALTAQLDEIFHPQKRIDWKLLQDFTRKLITTREGRLLQVLNEWDEHIGVTASFGLVKGRPNPAQYRPAFTQAEGAASTYFGAANVMQSELNRARSLAGGSVALDTTGGGGGSGGGASDGAATRIAADGSDAADGGSGVSDGDAGDAGGLTGGQGVAPAPAMAFSAPARAVRPAVIPPAGSAAAPRPLASARSAPSGDGQSGGGYGGGGRGGTTSAAPAAGATIASGGSGGGSRGAPTASAALYSYGGGSSVSLSPPLATRPPLALAASSTPSILASQVLPRPTVVGGGGRDGSVAGGGGGVVPADATLRAHTQTLRAVTTQLRTVVDALDQDEAASTGQAGT